MTSLENEEQFLQFCRIVIELHKSGDSVSKISMRFEEQGIDDPELKNVIKKIIDSYKNGRDLSRKPNFINANPEIREILFFFGGIAMVFFGSVILSVILGIINALFSYIRLGDVGEILVGLGEKAAGMLIGAISTFGAQACGSSGMLIGGWIGAGLYYLFLFMGWFELIIDIVF